MAVCLFYIAAIALLFFLMALISDFIEKITRGI